LKNRDRALRLLAVGIVFITVIVETAHGEGIVRGVIPYAADVSPVLVPASIPVGDPSKYIEAAIWQRRHKQIVGSQSIRENTFSGFDDLSRHQQNRCGASSKRVIGSRREPAENLHPVLAHYMDSNAPAPIPVHESAGWKSTDSDFGWRIYMVHPDPRTLFGVERFGGNISLPFGLLCEFVSGIGLRECTVGNIFRPVGLVLGLDGKLMGICSSLPDFFQRLVRHIGGLLGSVGGSFHFVQLTGGIVSVSTRDDNQQHRARGLDTLRPICFLLIAIIAAGGTVYSLVSAFDGGRRLLLYIPLSFVLLFIAFKFIHLGLHLLDPW
jgi:hypothetical protein